MRNAVFTAIVFLVGVGAAVVLFNGRRLDITGALPDADTQRAEPKKRLEVPVPKSSLTGLPCARARGRPLAVMLADDPLARPLSGVGEAEVVVEMPVTQNQVTRLMALYQCSHPRELGSVRSARHDFLPLAAGFDAIYSHWGGSHFALEKLATRVLDNVDALINPYDAYVRKRRIPAPHNGFTSYERLWQAAEKLGYRTTLKSHNIESQSSHETIPNTRYEIQHTTINIPYNPHGYAVRWEYDAERKTYKRLRAGEPEVDKNTGQQVAAGVVVVMKAIQKHLEDQYTDVKVVGSGPATIYQEGGAISATWQKADFDAPLRFLDENRNDVPLVAGKRWIEIVTN